MSAKTIKPEKLISDKILSIAKRNNAKSYATWLNDHTLDPRLKAYDDATAASTVYALKKRDAKGSPLSTMGYGKYISDLNRSKYLDAINKVKNEEEMTRQKSISGYQQYVDKLESKRKDLVDEIFRDLVTLSITDVTEAYRRAKLAGLSESDAKAVAKDTTSIARTDLFRKTVNNIITRYYTSVQAKEYASSLGLPREDVEELGRIANILNNLPSSSPEYYSSGYAQYIKDLKNTTK